MRRCLVVLVTAALVIAVATPAAAQQRRREARRPVPDAGMLAVGMSVSASIPSEPALMNGITLGASAEGYFTPRVSIRGQFSGSWWDIFGHSFNGTVNPMVFTGNVVYNFERGVWHPYVTGGAGIYHYRFTEGVTTSSDTKAGANFGGGAEFFVSRHDTFSGEVLLHAVPGLTSSRLAQYQARFWTIAFGYKRYF